MTIDTEVAVIGGGINGAGIAQAVAAAGYQVALFERSGWAAGTSSKSSKLIHGGLRYLESAQLPLVYNSLAERRLLLKNAPQLVRPVRFHIPVYRSTRRRPWQIQAGLALYRTLALFDRLSTFRRLPRREWPELDGLSGDGLQAVFEYWDAQTDDRALTAAVVHSAELMGAQTFCPAELIAAEYLAGGYRLTLETASGPEHCSAQVLINAAGPWVAQVAQRLQPAPPARPLSLVRGSHILVPGTLQRGVYYLESPQDGRAVFAMPWGEQTLVGTTEAEHRGDPDEVSASAEEQQYLQQTFAHYFPERSADILDSFAGLRVLPSDGDSPFARSRESFLQCQPPAEPQMIAVYGGKLTSYRHTAEKVVQLLPPRLGHRKPRADTRTLPLYPLT